MEPFDWAQGGRWFSPCSNTRLPDCVIQAGMKRLPDRVFQAGMNTDLVAALLFFSRRGAETQRTPALSFYR